MLGMKTSAMPHIANEKTEQPQPKKKWWQTLISGIGHVGGAIVNPILSGMTKGVSESLTNPITAYIDKQFEK